MWSYNKKEFAFPVLLVDRMQITNVWFQLLCNAAKILSFLKQFDWIQISYSREVIQEKHTRIILFESLTEISRRVLLWLKIIILLKMFLWGSDTTVQSLECFLYYVNQIPFLVEGLFESLVQTSHLADQNFAWHTI